ncbi:MAG: hypothetical protein KBT31_02640, partial [Firmicutes bacterium]|nr:hypothetical protein [Candidatus Colimorpha enterica]
FLIMSVLGGLAGYLNLKHIIIPDVDFGIVRSVRGFNILSLLLEAFTLAEVGLNCFLVNSPIIYIQGVLGIIYILFLPVLDAEVKKWTL